MLTSSTRSIRGYVCVSCLSSALIHRTPFVSRNGPRFNTTETSPPKSSPEIREVLLTRNKKKLKSQSLSVTAASSQDADKAAKEVEGSDGVENGDVESKDESESGATAPKVGKKRYTRREKRLHRVALSATKGLKTVDASSGAEAEEESRIEEQEKTADDSIHKKDDTASSEESKGTESSNTTTPKQSKTKKKTKPATKLKAEERPLVSNLKRRKLSKRESKRAPTLTLIQEFEACIGQDKLKKRNLLISRASLPELVKLVRSGKLDDNEKALTEMFLKVRMSVRRKEVRSFEEKNSEEFDAIEDDEGPARRISSKRTVRPAFVRASGGRRPIENVGPPKSVNADDLQLVPLENEMQPVPGLSYGLDRVLFNPGVYNLRDPRSRTFNFDPYLESIMPVTEFDFDALKEYITSSRDQVLISAANEEKKKYTGSTSSMGAALSHFHFLLSHWRPINIASLSKSFDLNRLTFSAMQRCPSAIFLRWRDGVYAIDADKQFDTANILMMLGKSMEKLLTLPTEDFEKYRRINSGQISEEERNETESYHYTTMGDFLMRSQLDAFDPRLPGTGMFDLKTRAVVSIRMDSSNWDQGMDYEIRSRQGVFESFEREYYDMIRSAFLKYSLQVRMGRMDGIFVAYHNTQRIFGFQYINLSELDYTLHGTYDTTIGDSEFKLSVDLLNKALDQATAKFPKQSLRLHIETRGMDPTDLDQSNPITYIFAEPITEEQIDQIQQSNKAEVEEFERRILGMHNENESLEKGGAENSENEEAGIGLDGGEIGDDSLPAKLWLDEQLLEPEVIREPEEEIEEIEKPDDMEELSAETQTPRQDNDDLAQVDSSNTEKPSKTSLAEDEATKSLREYYNALAHNFKEDPNDSLTKQDSKTKDPPTDLPLLAMSLTVQNKVNGNNVKRPENLTSKDNWTIDYWLTEEKSESKARSLYSNCLSKRRMAFDSASRVATEPNVDEPSEFVQELRELSQKGKEWRKEQDRLDQIEKIKVYAPLDSNFQRSQIEKRDTEDEER